MTRTPMALALSLALTASTAFPGQQPKTGGRPDTPLASARDHLKELQLELQVARTLAGAVGDRTVRDRLEQSIAKMEREAKAVQVSIDRLAQGGAATPAVAMNDEDFGRMMKSIKSQSFDDGKLNIVRDTVRHKHFTCAQATQLVKQFSFSDGQKSAAIALYPRLVDPANFHEVLGAMTFDTDRAAVRKSLGLAK